MTSGDRSVGGENQTCRRECPSLLERQMLSFHQANHALYAQKHGMPFVHVVNRGLEPGSFQRAIASDAQHDFLEAHFQVATIKLIGDFPVLRTVAGQVGVQEEQLQATDSDGPNLGNNRTVGSSTWTRTSGSSFMGKVWKLLSS